MTHAPPPHLSAHRIPSLPPTIYYIPNFLPPDDEAILLAHIAASPPHHWIQLAHRRLQAHPAALTRTNALLAAAPLPAWLAAPVLPRLAALALFADSPHAAPNHCLLNEYRPGQGILPHEDGPAYHPVVATVSLGGTVVLDVADKPPRTRAWRIVQEPRSLLVTAGSAYVDMLHGIAATGADVGLGPGTVANWGQLGDAGALERAGGRSERGLRVSLTFRDVVKTVAGERIFGRARG